MDKIIDNQYFKCYYVVIIISIKLRGYIIMFKGKVVIVGASNVGSAVLFDKPIMNVKGKLSFWEFSCFFFLLFLF